MPRHAPARTALRRFDETLTRLCAQHLSIAGTPTGRRRVWSVRKPSLARRIARLVGEKTGKRVRVKWNGRRAWFSLRAEELGRELDARTNNGQEAPLRDLDSQLKKRWFLEEFFRNYGTVAVQRPAPPTGRPRSEAAFIVNLGSRRRLTLGLAVLLAHHGVFPAVHGTRLQVTAPADHARLLRLGLLPPAKARALERALRAQTPRRQHAHSLDHFEAVLSGDPSPRGERLRGGVHPRTRADWQRGRCPRVAFRYAKAVQAARELGAPLRVQYPLSLQAADFRLRRAAPKERV